MAKKLVERRADGSVFLHENENLRWFNAYAACRECGKPSAGLLMDSQNSSHGDHCRKCADKRLANSKLVREQLAAM